MAATVAFALAASAITTYALNRPGCPSRITRLLYSYHNENGTFEGISLDELMQNHLTREFVVELPKEEVIHRALCGLNNFKTGSNLVLNWEDGSIKARASTTNSVLDSSDLFITVTELDNTKSTVVIHSESLSTFDRSNQNNIKGVKLLERAIKTEQDPPKQIQIPKWRKRFAPALRFTVLKTLTAVGLITMAVLAFQIGQTSQADSRASILYESGQFQEVLADIDEATKKSHAWLSAPLQIKQALSLAHLSKVKEAEDLLTKLIDERNAGNAETGSPDSKDYSLMTNEYRAALAYIYALDKKDAEAKQILKTLEEHSEDISLERGMHLIKGTLRQNEGNAPAALRELGMAMLETDSRDLKRDCIEQLAIAHRSLDQFKEAAADELTMENTGGGASRRSPLDDSYELLFKLFAGACIASAVGTIGLDIRRAWLRDTKFSRFPAAIATLPTYFEPEASFNVNHEFEECFDRCLQAISETDDLRVSDISAEDAGIIKVSNGTGNQTMTLKLVSIADRETRLVIQTCSSDLEGLEKLKLKLMA